MCGDEDFIGNSSNLSVFINLALRLPQHSSHTFRDSRIEHGVSESAGQRQGDFQSLEENRINKQFI